MAHVARNRDGKVPDARRATPSRSGYCHHNGKASFKTKKRAIRAKDRANNAIQKEGRQGPVAQLTYAYRCSFCGQWHLTSREKT